jgi:hypothetical protein
LHSIVQPNTVKMKPSRGGVHLRTVPKCTIVAGFIVVLLVFAPLLLPLSNGTDDSSNEREYWINLAEKAWQFYQPGKGVNSQTGLHSAGIDWPYFTEWDLGTYVQALLDAKDLGLLQDSGDWGFNSRMNKIFNFLETRPLTRDNEPYLIYDSRNGKNEGDSPSFDIDEGKLYLALSHLKTIRPDLQQRIDSVVKTRQNNTSNIVPRPELYINANDAYCYYISFAFQAFGFDGWADAPQKIISHLAAQPKLNGYGVELPQGKVCNEPILLTVFDVGSQDSNFTWLESQVYLAQKARYDSTGHFTAFSEGNTGLSDPGYVYEFVAHPDGSTFKVVPQITPIAYLKVAVAFDAIYSNDYTRKMVDYITKALPVSSNGFQEGVAEDGRVVSNIIDRTNGLVISAARYAISKLSNPSPSPETPSPSVSLSSLPSASSTSSTTATPSSSSITASPSFQSPTSPTSTATSEQSSSPTSNPTNGWQNQTVIIGFTAGASCVFVSVLTALFIRRRRLKT